MFKFIAGKKVGGMKTLQQAVKEKAPAQKQIVSTSNGVQGLLDASLKQKLGGTRSVLQNSPQPAAARAQTVQEALFGKTTPQAAPAAVTYKGSPKIGSVGATTQSQIQSALQKSTQTVKQAAQADEKRRNATKDLSRYYLTNQQPVSGTPVADGSLKKTAAATPLLDMLRTGKSPAMDERNAFYESRGINTGMEKGAYQTGVLFNGGQSTNENPILTGVTYPLSKIAANIAMPVIGVALKGAGYAEKELANLTDNKYLADLSNEALRSNLTQSMNQGIEDTVRPGKAEGLLGEVASLVGGVLGAGAMGAPFESLGVSADIAPKIGIGLQSGEQAISKALDEGASTKDAVKYGVLNGMMNAATEGIAGGIPGLGEGSLSPYISKLPGLAQIGANMAGEGAENALQEALDPVTQRLTYNPNAQNASKSELWSAFGWGAALSGVMEGAGAVVNGLPEQDTIDTRIGKNLAAWSGENVGETVQSLVETGQEYAPDTSARKAADNAADLLARNGTLTERQLGKLWRANAETQQAEALAYFKGEDMSPYTRTQNGRTILPTAREVNEYELRKAQNDYARKVANTLAQYNVRGVVMTELPEGESAKWENGTVYVSSKLDTASAINEKVAHEIGHAAGESDAAFTNDVLKVAAESGIDIKAETEHKRAVYSDWMKKQGMSGNEITVNTSDKMMHDEIVCDFIGRALKDGDLATRLTDRPKIAQRMLDAVNALRGHSSVSQPEASRYAVLAGKLRAAVDAGGAVQSFTGVPAAARFAIDEEGNADFTTEETEAAYKEIAGMDPVAEITGDEFQKGEVDLVTRVTEFFNSMGNHIFNQQLGDITLDRRSAKDDVAHKLNKKKAASFAAIPEVIKQGKVIDYQHEWKGRNYDTAVIAAPVMIGDEPYFEGVVVIRSRGENRFYVHDVITQKEDTMSFKTGADISEGRPGDKMPSLYNLLQKAQNVKSEILTETEDAESGSDGRFFGFPETQIQPTDSASENNVAQSGENDKSEILSQAAEPTNSRFSIDSDKDTASKYEGRSLSQDRALYSYAFLTSLPDMKAVHLPEVPEVRDTEGNVSAEKVVAAGMKNARSVGAERDGKIFVRNAYTGRPLLITAKSVRHGINGTMNRFLTNARLGSVIGDVVQNAVPVNAMRNKAADVSGTYAMVSYATDSRGREFIALVTVEQYSGNISGIEAYDVTHAISGRQKNGSQVDTKSQGFYPIKATNISISSLLQIVKSTHQSVLSEDVLKHLGEERNPNGDFAGKVRFSIDEPGYMDDVMRDAEERDRVVQPWEETERQAGAAGYPVLDGKQVFPFRTWVRDTERGNYGLVVDKNFDREDGQLLTVSFWNKEQGARAKVDIPVSELKAVSGKYQPEDAELRSLFESEPADSLRGAVSKADYEEYRSSYDEAHGIAPGTTVDYKFEDLPPKAANYTERSENKLVRSLAELLDVPYKESRNDLKPLARTITEEYLRTGTVSEKTANALFGEAWDKGIKTDETFYNDNKYIKDELADTAISISESDAHDIPDFNDWRKRQFGKLKISRSGIPVDVRYTELSEQRPDLFPPEITAASDQLQRMANVSAQIVKVEKSLDAWYGEQADTYREGARQDFDAAMADYLPELSQIRKYYEQRAREKTAKKDALKFAGMELDDQSVQYVRQLWKDQKEAKRQLDRAKAKNLMTDADNEFVDRAIRGEISIENIPEGLNAKGIRAIYEARGNFEEYDQQIQAFNRKRKAALRAEADTYLADVLKWKDKPGGFRYARETMERNIRDIAPRGDAEGMIARYFEPVHQNEAEATRLKNVYRDRIRDLNISRKAQKGNSASEAAAVQFLGEAEDNIQTLEAQTKKGRQEDWRNGHTLQEWRDLVVDFKAKNPNMDFRKVERAVSEFRSIYNDLFDKMNDARIKNGYEPVDYRKGYFPHFQDGHTDEVFAKIGKALGMEMNATDLPTSINGITHTFKPGIQYQGAAHERTGFETDYDAVEGFDKYIESAAGVICHTNDLQSLRALAEQIRYRSSDKGIQEQIDALRDDPSLTMEEREGKIRDVYDKGRTTLSNFIGNLDEYTNLLAGKKSFLDRNMERMIGRKSYNIAKAFENRIAANMVSVNPGSWLTNFIPLTQGSTGVSQKEMLGAMWDTLKAYKTDDGFAAASSFLTNRRGSDPLVRTWQEQASAKGSKPMEYIDQFTADTLVRARVKHDMAQGMSEDAAMNEADGWAAGIMADRSRGSEPTLFAATNPGAKLFTQFQLEVNNQMSWLFKDLPREYQDKGKNMLAVALMKFLIGSWLYNEVYEHFIGRRPAPDPLGILNDTVGDITGRKLPNTMDALAEMMQGKTPTTKVEKKSLAKTGTDLGENIAENIPFVGGLMGGGRLPISSALPNVPNVWNASAGLLSGEGNARKNRDTLVRELEKPAAYVIPPFGGGQLKKAIQGIRAAAQGGRYGVDSQGRDVLQYPVFSDTLAAAAKNTVQAALFGPTALPTGRAWIQSGFKSAGAAQTEVYKQLLGTGEKEREAYSFINQLSAALPKGDETKKDVQLALLTGSTLNSTQRNIVYYGMLASDKEKELIEALDNMGAENKNIAGTLGNIYQASKAEDKRNALIDADLTDEQKQLIYKELISDKDPEIVQTCLDDGMSMNEYLKYASDFEGSKDYAEKYTNLKVAGITGTAAAEILTGMADLQPPAGKDEVTFTQKLRVIADSSLDDAGKLKAVNAALDKTTVTKMNQASGYGISVNTYTEFQETLPHYDADGNGSYKQAEVEAALDNMELSNTERAVLWQLRTGGKHNPFDSSIGVNIRAEAAADKETAKATSSNSLLTDLFGAAAASPLQSSGNAQSKKGGGSTTADDIQRIMFG